jgi:hypothetical protein
LRNEEILRDLLRRGFPADLSRTNQLGGGNLKSLMSREKLNQIIMSTFKVNIPAGPLWSNDEAQKVGPFIAAAHLGKFTGQWTTVVPSAMSVIEIELPVTPTGSSTYTMDVLAGPLMSNEDAKAKCPQICASYGGVWNGQWTTVVAGKMSVCGCTFTF